MIPGRNGGVIAGCVTPSRKHPHEGQWSLGLPGLGLTMRKSTAARRLRDVGKPIRSDDPSEVLRAAHEALRGPPDHVPYPAGVEFPHRVGSSRCDPEHRLWRGYDARLREAEEIGAERAALELPMDATDREYKRARAQFTADDFRHDPHYPVYAATEQKCATDAQARESVRRGKAQFTSTREAAQKRARAILEGVDVSGAEYRDTLRERESKPKKRRR